jgi:ABC-type Na+ efflux pump permease subunit
MSGTALTTDYPPALDRLSWLDEALARREWSRTSRQMGSGRWHALFMLLLLALWLPALSTGSYASATVSAWRWPFASLAIATCVCGTGVAFLRASQIWAAEARGDSLEAWLLTLQRPDRLALTVVLSGAVPACLMATPALVLLALTALRTSVGVGALLGTVAFFLTAVLAGAAGGSALFFLQAKAFRPRPALLGTGLLAALVLALWLRVEYVESGWSGPWERHPGRFLFALLLLSPIPHLLGVSSSEPWRTWIVPRFGDALAPESSLALLGLFYLALTACGVALSSRGFQLLRDDPARLRPRRSAGDEADAPVHEEHWRGFRNPIWTRDIRTRLRSREAIECIFFASLTVAAAAFFPLLAAGSQLSDPLQAADVARQVFLWLTMTLGAFVTLIAPGLTAESITLERERGTLDLLLTTPMRPREILNGKLLGAASILALLLSPSLPLFGVCTVFHGASAAQVLGVYFILGSNLAVCAYFGITASAVHRRLVYAKLQAYLLSLAFAAFPGGFLWSLWALASPSVTERRALIVFAPALLILCTFVVALLWGHATERLRYTEPEAP